MADRDLTPSSDMTRLIAIMKALRTPVTGCPWDIEQTFASIAPYTIEEAYEVADAISRNDLHDLCDELGDLLLQVVFHARMAEEQGVFAFGDVVQAITEKLIRRHPHVFGERAGQVTQDEVNANWNLIRAEERRLRAARRGLSEEEPASLLAAVKAGQPTLAHALALQDKASTVGFDWNDPRAVLAKIREEADEIEAALDAGAAEDAKAEVGDLMFAVVNLARHLDADPDMTLRATNIKFQRRFASIERALAARGKPMADATLDEMEALWVAAKQHE